MGVNQLKKRSQKLLFHIFSQNNQRKEAVKKLCLPTITSDLRYSDMISPVEIRQHTLSEQKNRKLLYFILLYLGAPISLNLEQTKPVKSGTMLMSESTI